MHRRYLCVGVGAQLEVGGGYMVLEIRVDNWEKKEDVIGRGE
jgi:hypothetical protein